MKHNLNFELVTLNLTGVKAGFKLVYYETGFKYTLNTL